MSTLEILEQWIRSEYLEKLGVQIAKTPTDNSSGIWIRKDPDAQAHFFDADLGVWFKFIELNKPADVGSQVQECIQTSLADAAQLLWKTGLQSGSQDSNGAWTVTLIFLIHSSCQTEWNKAIQTLRAESGFTEELAIDVLVFSDAADLSQQLQLGSAMPHLLISSRMLLLLPAKDIDSWLSADAEVKKLLDSLPDRFSNTRERELVSSMIAQVLKEMPAKPSQGLPSAPQRLDSVSIRNLRNISDFTLKLRSPEREVLAHIIHGPNGTGKSSIFEALSIAVTKSSRRMVDYLKDSDIYRPTAVSYVKNVLTPLEGQLAPKIEAAGADVLTELPADGGEADRLLARSDGTLLAQEDARNFVQTTGRELGARVLSGYSILAQNVQNFCEREYGLANSKRQDWLRQFGIAASVTREESRLTKLVEHFIGLYHPMGTQQVGFWLAALEQRIPADSLEAKTLAFDWAEADGKLKRDDLAKIVVQLDRLGASAECERAIFGWIERRNKALIKMLLLRRNVKNFVDSLTAQRSEIEEDLKKWQQWLIGGAGKPTVQGIPAADFVAEERNLNLQLQASKDLGLAYSEQFQHLNQVRGTFLPSWIQKNPDLCPTCNSDHSGDGGIGPVIERICKELEQKLNDTRKQYAEILAKIRTLQKHHEELGQCPISNERRNELSKLLGFADQNYEAVDRLLMQQNAIEDLLNSLDLLISPPTLPVVDDTTVAASRVWGAIETENTRGAALWTLPDQWSNIRQIVDSECLLIIQRHLPKTLQAVWTEIAMTITPARWNLADKPRLTAESKRGSESLKIVVGNDKRQVGVRHIFNQAENHILGLAWFFTRYLSSGRFEHSLIALDDPAQEMDQTTFRSFTRLIQSFCRLHERYELPLTLVLLLHQEDRALDAARATNHQVTSLKWAKEISSSESIETLILISPEFKAPLPKALQLSEPQPMTAI